MTKVLLKLNLKMPDGKRQDQTQPVNPKNLMLTTEYTSSKVADPAKAPAAGKGGPSKHDEDESKSIAKWILGSSAPTDVHVETKWTSLVADQDELCKVQALKGRVFTGLQVMSEVLPKWTLKDFVVVHRRTEKGVWKGEVWTKRDFEAHEILLAPYSSQLKDTHLTGSANAGVTLPMNGRGAHPDNSSLALDGRLRNLMAKEGALDDKEHEGSLYWLITRTSDPASCNLHTETMTFHQKTEVTLSGPACKKRKMGPVEWAVSDMPSIPCLTNKKPIGKHTQLLMFLPPSAKDK